LELVWTVPDTVADAETNVAFEHKNKVEIEPLDKALLESKKRVSDYRIQKWKNYCEKRGDDIICDEK
jgi:hypothetical protein